MLCSCQWIIRDDVIKMLFVVIVLCVITAQGIEPDCGTVTYHGSQTLIIGGKSAQRGEVPWHAAIFTKTTIPYKQICGGSLVSNNIVISAAHCFWSDRENQLPAENYAVGTGKLYRTWETNLTKEVHQRSDVKEIHIPVRYQGNEANNQEDIAIVIVSTPFQYTTFVRTVCVDFDINLERKQLQPGKYGKVAGWGLTDEDGPSSQILKVIELPYVDTRTCINESPYTFRPHITGDKFCAGYKNSHLAVCKGDSGGGLVFPETVEGQTRYYLRGIVSSAPAGDSRCNANAYTSFTQLLKHEHFIKLFWGSTTAEEDGCDPIPKTLTSSKTGKKAWDKCIEYQEKLVFPCEWKVPESKYGRVNRCHHNVDELSTGAEDALPREFPHMAFLGYGDEVNELNWLCGGSLISENFVLTTGHCSSSREGPVIYVALGILKRSDVTDESKRFKIKQVHRHPNHKPPVRYHDLALLELEKSVKFNEFLVPACLHTGDTIDDSHAVATGWGRTSAKGPFSNELKKMILTMFDAAKCKEEYPPSRFLKSGIDMNTQMCYIKLATSRDTCQGDGGGPLQVKNKKIACMYTIIGLTSFGKSCDIPGTPGIYTKVSYYLDWIEKIVWP